jgi:hypothetical protein
MVSLVALYRGDSIATATLIAVSADPGLARDVAGRLLAQPVATADPVVAQVQRGRRAALRLIEREDADEQA